MGLQIQDLGQLTQADYNTARQLLLGWLQQLYPTYRFQGGPLDQFLLQPSAILEAANQDDISRVIQASSLAAITADPTLEDDADQNVVSNLLSNYRITQLPAAAATGQVTIILTQLLPTVIAAGTVFTDPFGNTYSNLTQFNGKVTSSAVVATTDRLITAVGNGTYAMTISVTATATGPQGNISAYTVLTVTAGAIANFSTSIAATDFTGGQNLETNTSMINRMYSSWSGRTAASRIGLDGLFRLQPGFEALIADSTVGFGDPEEVRNHSILPLAMPGRVDSYVRTQAPYETVVETIAATLVGSAVGGTRGVWQIVLTRAYAPIYFIQSIVLPANSTTPGYSSYPIDSLTPGYDVSVGPAGSTAGLLFLPDIKSATEAAYSRYQTLTFTFTDTDTPWQMSWVIGTTTNNYVVTYLSMPGIATLQDAVASRPVRSTMGDCLVKTPVPCFCDVTVNVNYIAGGTTVNAAQVQEAVAAAINNTGFIGTLPFTTLSSAAQGALPTGSSVGSVTASGTVYYPNGSTAPVTGSSSLTVPADPTNMVSVRTTCFFCIPGDITVNITTVQPPSG